jgi:hypothetical protein
LRGDQLRAVDDQRHATRGFPGSRGEIRVQDNRAVAIGEIRAVACVEIGFCGEAFRQQYVVILQLDMLDIVNMLLDQEAWFALRLTGSMVLPCAKLSMLEKWFVSPI